MGSASAVVAHLPTDHVISFILCEVVWPRFASRAFRNAVSFLSNASSFGMSQMM